MKNCLFSILFIIGTILRPSTSLAESTENEGAVAVISQTTCEQYFEQNRCREVIAQAGSSAGFLDCQETITDKAISCTGQAGVGYIIARSIPARYLKPLGRISLPLFVLYLGGKAANKLTEGQQRCYSNTPYKAALLFPVMAYHGEEFAESLLKQDCHYLENYANNFIRRIQAKIRDKEAEKERYHQYLERVSERNSNSRVLNRRFPPEKRELTEQEINFLMAMEQIEDLDIETLKKGQEFIDKNPCRSWSFYVNALCGIAGGVGGSVHRQILKANAARLASAAASRAVHPIGGKHELQKHLTAIKGQAPSHMANTTAGLRVNERMRAQIQGLRKELLEYSKTQCRYGRPVNLHSNHCVGASAFFQRVLKEKMNLDTTVVTYSPSNFGKFGWEHSYLIVPNYFGKNSPLVIDTTIKQFMPQALRKHSHDIFVGSPDELLGYMNKYRVDMVSGSTDETFQNYLRAYYTGRADGI